MTADRWEGIDAFVAVHESGSFSGAATRLGVSTSQVSRQVAQLEARLQVRLLYRTTRQVSLTDAGAEFLARCQKLLKAREDAFEAIGEQDGELRGTLRLTCSAGYGEKLISSLVNRFAAMHPKLGIELDLANNIRDIVGEGWDMAVRTGALHDNRLVATRLAARQVYLCGSPEYLALRGAPRTVADLAEHSCIVGHHPWRFKGGRAGVKIRPRGRLGFNNGFPMLDAALQGLGLCQLPEVYVAEHIASGALVSVLDEFRPPADGIWAVYPNRQRLPAKVKAMVGFLAANLSPPQIPERRPAVERALSPA